MEPNKDAPEVLETPEGEEVTEDTSETTETPEKDTRIEELEALRKEKEALESKNKQLYERLKKGETKPKEETSSGLDPIDVARIVKANIDVEDIGEVKRWADFNKISIEQALKDQALQQIVSVRVEQRKTAAATVTKSPRVQPKQQGEALINAAEQGRLPESDDGIEALARARWEGKGK